MKRALIITYYWPPTGGSGVQRWVKFSKYFPQFGWQPVIYTPENPEMQSVDHSLSGDIPAEAEIIKRHISEVYGIYHKLSGKRAKGEEVNPINGQKKTFKQKLFLAIRSNLFIPDPRITWLRPSARFLKRYLKEHPVDVIITTGPPWSMHLIGRKVSKATGIPWIADFRDPWTQIFYYKHLTLTSWADRLQHKMEKAVLQDATAVVSVSPLERDGLEAIGGRTVELITNGYDESDFDQVVEQDGYFNITNTGLFSKDGIPESLWKVLAAKCKSDPEFDSRLRIRLVGKTDQEVKESIKAAGLGDKMVDLGYQSHQIAVREQMNASVLILMLRKEPEFKAQLPGKLFEYLAAAKPIFGIGQTDGAMSMIVHQTNSGDVFDWEDINGMAYFINENWKRFKDNSFIDLSDGKEKYSRKSVTADMVALMESLIK